MFSEDDVSEATLDDARTLVTVDRCVPSTKQPPPECGRALNAEKRTTELRWNGTAIVKTVVPQRR